MASSRTRQIFAGVAIGTSTYEALGGGDGPREATGSVRPSGGARRWWSSRSAARHSGRRGRLATKKQFMSGEVRTQRAAAGAQTKFAMIRERKWGWHRWRWTDCTKPLTNRSTLEAFSSLGSLLAASGAERHFRLLVVRKEKWRNVFACWNFFCIEGRAPASRKRQRPLCLAAVMSESAYPFQQGASH